MDTAPEGGVRQNTGDQARIGPITLMPGIPPREVFVFLLVTGIAVMMTAFIALMQPYVFTEMVGVPRAEQGRLAGQLMTVQQAVVLVCVGFAGALADRIGRRAMVIFALVGYSMAAFAYPLAGGVAALFVIRFCFGIASSAHTAGGPPRFFDYVDNASRGRFMALVMVFYGLISVLMVGVIGAALPGWLHSAGYDTALAGTYALWACGILGLGAALVAAMFLMPDAPKADRRKGAAPVSQSMRELLGGFRRVVAHARTNRRFGVLLLTSFVVRTDEAVVGSFLALWITLRGAQEGLGTTGTVAIAGTALALMRACSFVIPPILGVLLDKWDRTAIYVASLVLVGVSFLCAPLVTSVTGWEILALALFIGIAESTQTIAQQAFFGQEAPADLRGTAYGLLAFFGTASVVLVSLASGYLFDLVGLTAPFVLIGLLHVIFSALAIGYLALGRTADNPITDATGVTG
ncbi:MULTISPECIES: MFS transporter [Novosphingobium]|uniref:MFS transporter n=1 Tax=Novosphingobium TaxID=165696 RepID=UPI0022F25E68|nr:MFS transporter [Novosphingobium resinovorum]GLK44210.1 MFS transporter [Novosphingobium resinovorum]